MKLIELAQESCEVAGLRGLQPVAVKTIVLCVLETAADIMAKRGTSITFDGFFTLSGPSENGVIQFHQCGEMSRDKMRLSHFFTRRIERRRVSNANV